MSRWRSIKTAPRDGTKVDLWYRGEGRQTDAFFKDGRWTWWHSWKRNKPPRKGGVHVFSYREDVEPTHWMPIPAKPSR